MHKHAHAHAHPPHTHSPSRPPRSWTAATLILAAGWGCCGLPVPPARLYSQCAEGGGAWVIVSASVMVETFLTLKQVRENRVGFQGGVPPKPQPFIWGAVGGARQHLQSQSRTVCGQETQRPLQVNIEGGLPAADPPLQKYWIRIIDRRHHEDQ